MIYYYYRDHALRHFKKVAYSLKQLDILSCVHVTKYVTISPPSHPPPPPLLIFLLICIHTLFLSQLLLCYRLSFPALLSFFFLLHAERQLLNFSVKE